jgi:homogentisate 1,2-dioxygenase
MRKWITFPRSEGVSSKQAHADFPQQGIYEREMGRSGFFGPAAHFHHKHAPTAWTDWQGDLRPRAFDLNALENVKLALPWMVDPILSNNHCRFTIWHCQTAMTELVANADGDELLFIHQGKGHLYCDFGHLEITKGDYVMIPRNTMWRLEPIETMQVVMIEATNDSFQLPEKGMVGQHAVFDPAVLETPKINPQFIAQQSEDEWRVAVKRHNKVSVITYPFNPLDAIGWHGDLSVVRLNWRDIRPLMSHRYHLPPSAHTTFVASKFVVCTFVPRPIESDPGALKVPFYHCNSDYDEVLFYHEGDFFSRDNIDAGMVTFHPCGFAHGPHPKAFEKARVEPKVFTDEVAVMIDTRDALNVSDSAMSVENTNYVNSWR